MRLINSASINYDETRSLERDGVMYIPSNCFAIFIRDTFIFEICENLSIMIFSMKVFRDITLSFLPSICQSRNLNQNEFYTLDRFSGDRL